MAELFVFASSPVSLTELASWTGTCLGGVHKEVERLEASGLVKSGMVGRSRLVEADDSSPVYRELRGLLLKSVGPEPLLRAALKDIVGVEEAFIFGSWADPAERSPRTSTFWSSASRTSRPSTTRSLPSRASSDVQSTSVFGHMMNGPAPTDLSNARLGLGHGSP